MKNIFSYTILIGLFVIATVIPGFTSSHQEEGGDVAEETTSAEQNNPEFGSMIEVSGVVVVIDSDSDGNPDTVTVQNHIIPEYGRGLDLFEYEGKRVNISGELFTDGDRQVLDVISYELVEESPSQ